LRIAHLALLLPLAAAAAFETGCSVGRRLVPQSDIEPYEIGEKDFEKKVLVASRDSDFKIEVARRIGASLDSEGIYVKFIGLDQIDDADVSVYGAIVLMTTCISWGMDPATQSFLEKHGELSNIIVLITSGGGDWKPDMKDGRFDAITSASVIEDAARVAGEILARIRALLEVWG
jgi:hypothetical protein